jgi:hypothetical protein
MSITLRGRTVGYDNLVAGSAYGGEHLQDDALEHPPAHTTRYGGLDNNTKAVTSSQCDSFTPNRIQNGASTATALGGDTDQNTTTLGVELLTP